MKTKRWKEIDAAEAREMKGEVYYFSFNEQWRAARSGSLADKLQVWTKPLLYVYMDNSACSEQ